MKNSVEMTPRRKRQAMYLGLLAMGVLFALTNPDGAWLPIALAVALALDEILYLIAKRRHRKNGGETPKLIETTGVELEKNKESDPDDSENE